MRSSSLMFLAVYFTFMFIAFCKRIFQFLHILAIFLYSNFFLVTRQHFYKFIAPFVETKAFGDDFVFEKLFFVFASKSSFKFDIFFYFISNKSFSKLSSSLIFAACWYDLKTNASLLISLMLLLLVLLVSQLSLMKKNIFHLIRFITLSILSINFNL